MNEVIDSIDSKLSLILKNMDENDYVYFIHSDEKLNLYDQMMANYDEVSLKKLSSYLKKNGSYLLNLLDAKISEMSL